MDLHDVNARVERKETPKRRGRGPGSQGCYSGRGRNGARSRSGFKSHPTMEGGQMPFVRRIPKRGFTNIFKRTWAFVNLKDLNAFADGDVVTPEECLKRGIIPDLKDGLKVLGVGALERKLTVRTHRTSATAKQAIEAKGGSIELLRAEGDDARRSWKAKRGQGKSTQRRKQAIAKRGAKKA